jgi:hypothetical protein
VGGRDQGQPGARAEAAADDHEKIGLRLEARG